MTGLTKHFLNALERFGAPKGGETLSSGELASYRGRIPDSLLDFWEAYGLGLWLNGFIQFCSPQRYQPILELALKDDNQLDHSRSHVIALSAFGGLLIWNEDYRIIKISTLYHRLICAELFKPTSAGTRVDNIAIGIAIKNVDDDVYDPPDMDGKPMFKRVLKAHGPLGLGQIYALNLHPALGGSVAVENFRSKSALEALSIALQAGPLRVVDTSTPQMRVVREI